MSQPFPFRRWAVTLVLTAAAVASIATSPAPRLDAPLDAAPFVLTAQQPTLTQRLRVRLELREGLEGRDARASLDLVGTGYPTDTGADSDAGTSDAGSPPAARPVVLTVRDAAHPDVVLFRDTRPRGVELMRDCAQRTCEQTLLLEWSLGEDSVPPVRVEPWGYFNTELDPGEGTATLELVP